MKVTCSHCGTIGEEDAMRCTKCGTTLEYNNMPNNFNQFNNTAVSAKNSSKKANKAIIAIAIAATLAIGGAIAGGIAIANKNSYKSVIKDKLYSIETLDAEKLAATYPKFIYEGYIDESIRYDSYDDFVQTTEDTNIKIIEDNILNKLEEMVGDNLKFSYKINKIDTLSEKKQKLFCEAIEAVYKYDTGKINDIKKAEITVKVKGSDDTYEFDWEDVYLVKENKEWYLLNSDFESDSIDTISESYDIHHNDWYDIVVDYYFDYIADDDSVIDD